MGLEFCKKICYDCVVKGLNGCGAGAPRSEKPVRAVKSRSCEIDSHIFPPESVMCMIMLYIAVNGVSRDEYAVLIFRCIRYKGNNVFG